MFLLIYCYHLLPMFEYGVLLTVFDGLCLEFVRKNHLHVLLGIETCVSILE